MPWYEGEEKKVARFLLLALLEQSPLFVGVDTDGKIKESLRTDEPLDLEPIELAENLAMPMAMLVGNMNADGTIVNGMMRLFEFKKE